MTYNVFGGTLNLAQSINLINYYIIINTVMNRRVHFSLGLDNCPKYKTRRTEIAKYEMWVSKASPEESWRKKST